MKFVGKFYPKAVTTSTSVYLRDGAMVIHPDHVSGSFITNVFDPLYLDRYRGFEFVDQVAQKRGLDQPQQLKFALRYNNTRWTFNGAAWVVNLVGWNNSAELRQGLPEWTHALQIECQMHRYPDKESPVVSELRFGCICYGSLNAYLMEFSLPEVISANFELTRWLLPNAPFPDVDPEQIVSIRTKNLPNPQGLILTIATIKPPVELIANQGAQYQVKETPAILLEMQDAEDVKVILSSESVRVSQTTADVYSNSRQYHQRIMLHVVAQRVTDATAIIDEVYQKLSDQGRIEVPAYAQYYAVMVDSAMTRQVGDRDFDAIEELQLPTITFGFILVGMTPPELVREVGIVEAFGLTSVAPQ